MGRQYSKKSAAALLLIGGEGPDRSHLEGLLAECEMIVAADSGLDLADRLGLQPDLVVGDMDSLADHARLDAFPPNRVKVFPSDKDETDTEIGLRLLRERGFRRVILVGGGEGRLDHLMGILSLFDNNVAEGRQLLETFEDEKLVEPWSLLKQGQVMMTFPRLVVLRTWVFNHTIHHRAHLCVYLRVNNVPVPG